MQEKINEMLKMQKALDKAICESKKVNPTLEQRYMALIDEIGELTHELKGNWCWWKDTQEKVNRQRVLEELVDVWHFALGIYLTKNNEYKLPTVDFSRPMTEIISIMIEHPNSTLNYTLVLTLRLGFSIDDVYEEYMRKNKINYERLNNGY